MLVKENNHNAPINLKTITQFYYYKSIKNKNTKLTLKWREVAPIDDLRGKHREKIGKCNH